MNGAFFMIDLDRFKQINETAEILKSVFCEDDIIGRMGGDEFCVFYTGSAKGYGNEEFSELYRRADRALYVQKFQHGKDGYTIYEQLDEENE